MNNNLKRKKLFVLDMDGTIYLDETPDFSDNSS